MISNDERHEAATRLRNVSGAPEWATTACCIAECLGEYDYPLWDDSKPLFNRLADLIEPEQERTCRNIAGDPNDFYCSECTAFIRGTMVDDLYCCHPIGKVISHCPNCQSKVMR